MKHQAINNLKFKRLMKQLSLPMWHAVGLLEGLWLFATHFARDGDLSRFSAADIATWLDYEADAGTMIDALVETKWLDRAEERLAIHDWDEHQPNWLKGIAARKDDLPQGTKSATKLPTKSHTKSATKCRTKQVIGIGNNKESSRARTKKFTKPTADEVEAYCRERKNSIKGQDFIDWYEQVGWVVGKSRAPMKCWKSAVHQWEAKRKADAPTSPADRIATADDLKSWNPTTGNGE